MSGTKSHERRKLESFNDISLFDIFLKLPSHIMGYRWMNSYLEKIQGKHGKPFTPGTLMRDNQIRSLNIDERAANKIGRAHV